MVHQAVKHMLMSFPLCATHCTAFVAFLELEADHICQLGCGGLPWHCDSPGIQFGGCDWHLKGNLWCLQAMQSMGKASSRSKAIFTEAWAWREQLQRAMDGCHTTDDMSANSLAQTRHAVP